MTVGDRQVPQGLPVKPNAVPTRQLNVIHVGVTAGHEVRHRDDPKDSIADSGTIELAIIFSVGTTVRHVIIAGKTDRDGIDGIGDVRHGMLHLVRGVLLLKQVLGVFRKLVNYFFMFIIFFLSNPFHIHFKALFLSNMGHRSSFVFERLRDPFTAQKKAYEGKDVGHGHRFKTAR